MSHPDLIQQIKAFLVEFDMRPSTFGRRFMGDPNFVRNTLRGQEHLPRTVQRAMSAMRAERAVRERHTHTSHMRAAND